MATLIQSKQIQGVVTASVITGDFAVNAGSVNLSGASGVSGSFSGSFIGDGSGLTGIHQNLDFNSVSKVLTISNGNSVDLTSLGGGGGGGGSSIWTTGSDFYKVSSDLQVTGSFSATSLTGSIDYSNLTNLPSGIFSGSLIAGNNITITSGSGNITITSSGGGSVPAGTVSGSSQINFSGIGNVPSGLISSSAQLIDGSNIVSGSVLRTLDGTGVVSGSVIRTFDGTGILSGSKTDISSLNTYTSSADSRLSSIEAATGSYLTSETDSQTLSISGDQLTISTGNTVTIPTGSSLPSGTVSSSVQLTTEFDTRYLNTSADGVVSGSVLRTLDGTGVISGSVLRTLDGTTVLSGSFIDKLPNGIISGSTYTTFSSSIDGRVITEKGRIDAILDSVGADKDSFAEIVDLINSVDTTNDNAFASHYTSSRQRDTSLEVFTSSIDTTIKSKLNVDNVLSGSIESLLPSGVISGSSQLTSSFDSRYLTSETDSQTLSISGDQLTISTGNTITIPSGSGGTTDYTQLTNVPSGIISGSVLRTLDGTTVLSGSVVPLLPSGVISGSTQITHGSGIVSGSVLRNLDGSGVISGSVLRNLGGTNVISGSVLRTLDGTNVLSGSKTNISSLNTFTSSIQSEVDALSAATSSYLTSETDSQTLSISGDQLTITGGNVVTIPTGSSLPSGVVSSSIQITDGSGIVSGSVLRTLDGSGVISGSVLRTLDGTGVLSGSDQIIYDGNRVISQEKLPTFFTSSFNPGTSGSVVEFLNAVFFPNTAPSITTGNQTIREYTPNGSTIVTIAGTDPEAQNLTFGTGSTYTDDLVRVATNGVLTLNALPTSASFNTDEVSGIHGHTFIAKATDTFNASVEKNITIFVTPNEAPKFRETSVSGNVITSVTSNLNENSVNDTLVKRVFFTDTETDTITIVTSSIDNNHFDVDIQSTYVDIKQNTGSLDFEQKTSYTFSITASDAHYENGQDSDSRTFLPITINVTDNLAPTLSNQEVSGLNENSSNGTSAGNISATDNESDSISFLTFDLHKLLLDGSTVTSGSYGGTSQATDPHENPFNMDSSGNVTRKVGVYLNSDIINSYQYRVKVRDNFNQTMSSSSVVTVPIADDIAATISDNWSVGPYIKESELNGTTIKTTNYGSTQADYNSNQSGTWASSNSEIAINSNGNLSVGFDVSGSAKQSGQSLTSTISFTNTFGTITNDSLSVSIIANDVPTATFTNQTSNLNANLATTNTNLVLVGITDTEADTPYSASLSGTDASKLNLDYQNSNSSSVYIRANEDLSAGTLTYNLKVTDNYDKSTTYSSKTITIASANNGTLGGDNTSYIIESAVTGAVYRDASGFGAGNASQLSVSYSPNYGSQVVGSYTSSRQGVSVDNSGNLTSGRNFSGSILNTDYTSTAITTDSTNSTLYGKSLHSHGLKIVQGAAISGQSAVPDLFTEKVAQVVKLMITGSGADIDDVSQANMIGTLKGELGTWHANRPTAQRILRGAGTDYTTNPLNDSNYSSYSGLQTFQDSHSTKDMIWYLNSTAASGSGDADITEVVEHLMHTIHSYGVRGGVEGSVNGLSWIPGMDSDWKTRELFLAFKQAVDNNVFSLTGYGDEDYNTEDTFELAVIEYLYLLNFNMWEYSSLWDGGSLSPEWNDNSRTQSGIQTNNALGYALYNKYIKPVLTKPSLSSLRSIFQDGDIGNPAIAGSSGYTPEVGSTLLSGITFRDQYQNIGTGSVTVNVFANQAPTATFTNQTSNFETDNAITGTTMVSMSISDTETDTPFSASLSGTDASSLQLRYVGATSSSVGIQATGNLSAATYNYNVRVTDNFNKSTDYNSRSFTVATSADYGKVYVYDIGFNNSTYNTAFGIQSEDGSTPPIPTPFSGIGFTEKIINGDVLGDSSFTYSYGSTITSNKLAEGTGNNVHTVLRAMGSSGVISRNTSIHFAILFPSGSDMSGIPTSTIDSYGGSTNGEYVVEVGTDGTSIDGSNTLESSEINLITLGTAHLGYTKWYIVGARNQVSSTSNFNLGLNSSSGSGGI